MAVVGTDNTVWLYDLKAPDPVEPQHLHARRAGGYSCFAPDRGLAFLTGGGQSVETAVVRFPVRGGRLVDEPASQPVAPNAAGVFVFGPAGQAVPGQC